MVELQGLLSDESPIPGVRAIPGQGTHVPLYMLGSSLFGAQLAAELGLPYAFASHFAPRALHDAIGIYRETFKPSEQLAEPYVIAALARSSPKPPKTPPNSSTRPAACGSGRCSAAAARS